MKKKILIGSPIHQKPAILKEFLSSLTKVHKNSFDVDYFFIDDNKDEESSNIISTFFENNKNTTIIKGNNVDSEYITNEITHYWKDENIWKVADYKNMILKNGLDNNYDYVFLIDSDIVMNPNTIETLLESNKDIISEIFWTRWQPDAEEMPQVWMFDKYDFYDTTKNLTTTQKNELRQEFLNKLRIPNVYKVGGLGACTLISKKAINIGVNFNKINNITLWGEDRHFCIRAEAIGLELWVDTHYPAYHIYRESMLQGVSDFFKINEKSVNKSTKLVVGMCIYNEAENYLEKSLFDIKQYADHIVIINDGSTDNSVEICEKILNGTSFEIINNGKSKFNNEIELREQLWNAIIDNNPDWIMILDADEIFEDKFKHNVKELLSVDNVNMYKFRLYDFWDEIHYRSDNLWCAHHTFRTFLLKYNKNYKYEWLKTKQHCGRFPNNLHSLGEVCSDLRLKHYGWVNHKLRIKKFARYMTLDPNGKFGSLEQYKSILDKNPNLLRWTQ
jgi:GT2 family glycosyltransferase